MTYKKHYRFLIGTPATLSYAREFIREIGDSKDHCEHYNGNYALYIFTKAISLDYEQKRPYKGDPIKEDRRMYLHLYFNPEKHFNDDLIFSKKMDQMKEELLSGHRVAGHEKDYQKYFIVKGPPVRGTSVSYKQEAIDAAHERYGFFVLISNTIKDPVTSLSVYRTRDVVEKAFGNLKDRLNLYGSLTSSESTLEGKLFVEFVALIYLSYIKRKMVEEGLYYAEPAR